MRGRTWLKRFCKSVMEKGETDYPKNPNSSTEWTKFMYKVIEGVAEELNCWIARRRPENKNEGGEYFDIDAVFFDNAHYEREKDQHRWERWDPFVLPKAAVELENNYDFNQISYCLWKLMCIRTSVRVLVCYQNSTKDDDSLKNHLENVIRQGSLMKGAQGDLLVIIGNDGGGRGEDAPWEDYFIVHEWRGDKLSRINC
jgi:hypothetical protein